MFLIQLRWWVFVLPGPVSRQNSSMCQGDENLVYQTKMGWLMWMVGPFWLEKIDENFGWTFLFNFKIFSELSVKVVFLVQKLHKTGVFPLNLGMFTFIEDRLWEHVMIKLRFISYNLQLFRRRKGTWEHSQGQPSKQHCDVSCFNVLRLEWIECQVVPNFLQKKSKNRTLPLAMIETWPKKSKKQSVKFQQTNIEKRCAANWCRAC